MYMLHCIWIWFQLWWWLCNPECVLPHYMIWPSFDTIFWCDFNCDGYYIIQRLFCHIIWYGHHCYEHGLSAAKDVLNYGPTRTHRSHGHMWLNPDQEDVPRPGVMARSSLLPFLHRSTALSHANVFCTLGSLIQTSIDEIASCSIERWDLSSVVQMQQSIS